MDFYQVLFDIQHSPVVEQEDMLQVGTQPVAGTQAVVGTQVVTGIPLVVVVAGTQVELAGTHLAMGRLLKKNCHLNSHLNFKIPYLNYL